MELRQMQKEREKIICALWKQLSNIVITHIQQTELKRLHLTELQKLDNAASLTITQHDQEISKQEEELKKLHREHDKLFATQEEQIQQLQGVIEATTKEFFRLRKTLMQDLNHDEKQLAHLTAVSNEAITHFDTLRVKGDHLLQLKRACEKFESEIEKVRKWETFDEEVPTLPPLTRVRPQTSVPKPPPIRTIRKLRSEEIIKPNYEATETFTIKTHLIRKPIREDSITIEKKVLSKKFTKSDVTAQSKLSSATDASTDTLSKTSLRHLNKLEGLWLVYNKVELDCIDLRREKKRMLQENEKLKDEIRKVLEASALGQSILSLKHGSGASSKRRFAFSAPVSYSTVH